MSLRATAPAWFPPGHPQARKAEAVDIILHPSPPQNCCPAPGFIFVQAAQPLRRGSEVPFARLKTTPKAQWKLASCQQSAPPPPAKKPSSGHSPGGKRKLHVPEPKVVTAPTDTKRALEASSSQAADGAQPLKTDSSPGVESETSSNTTAAQVAHERSLRGKTPTAVRQQYFGLFSEECLKFCSTPLEALKRAWVEEKVIFDRSSCKNGYLNDARHTLKTLRGLVPSSLPGLNRATLYRRLCRYLLTEDERKVNSYPFPDPERPGHAVLFTAENKLQNAQCRTCCRCGTEYPVTPLGLCVRPEQCYYHWGRPRKKFQASGWENLYTCCSAAVGSVGCQVAKQHVHDGRKDNLEGFVKTVAKERSQDAHPGIYALDCEMSFTIHGLELTRISMVDSDLRLVYDTFVKPDHNIVDYNTRFSGVTEADLARTGVTLRDVQAFLLNVLSSDSILIGHSLESDLLALKMIHPSVVDTAVLFPHHLGLPYKRSLRNLVGDYLHEVIQDNPAGHNSLEDAGACMRLVGWKIMEDAIQSSWNPGSPPLLVSSVAQACPWPGSLLNAAFSKPAQYPAPAAT
ncbi:RNA exonuclease 1 like protein [Fukomys damarensis]|uniref:RNA exonuclease 1 like protein n=2 Tax=Fukomys damarensis TaxID=885580 RepID=A0A091D9C2_FUKDA|nr:RNA exonuclease 1 like protein [Fukomys damarensis]